MATLKPTTVPAKRLAETISGASTTFKLNNIRSWAATATDLTSADFGDRLWAVFRNSTGTLMEIMEIDPTTITSASSPITIIARGLKFDGEDATEVAANKLTWVKGDTIVELGTHVPQLISQFVDKVGDQTVNGIKTFSSFPVKSGSTSPTSAAEFATKAYVDATATGNATYNQNTFTGTAGETLVASDLCYFKQSDQRWWKADADAYSTSIGVKLAIAQAAATAGNTLTLLGSGLNSNFSALTVSAPYFVSNTTGGISTTPGTFARFIGRAVSATTLHFDPDNGNVVGKYGIEIYGADSVGTDAYAITTYPAFLALKDGMVVRFKAGTANTGAATLAVDGLTAKTIKKNFNVDLATDDIKVNQIVTVVYEATTDTWQMVSQVANTSPSSVDIQTFTTAGSTSWTKPSGAKIVEVTVIGGGGGGGTGSGTAAGGAGGGWGFKKFNASALGSTENLTVGAGGAAATTGGTTTFGTTTLLRATGGQGASQNGATTGGTANGDLNFTGGSGGAGNNSAGPTDSTNNPAPRGGGAGGYNGGSPATPTAGQNGGGFTTNYVKAGGTGGTAGANNAGATPSSDVNLYFGGVGGGGGGYAGSGSGTGGAGGAGNLGSGGGGRTASGNGAVGGDGAVVVVTYF